VTSVRRVGAQRSRVGVSEPAGFGVCLPAMHAAPPQGARRRDLIAAAGLFVVAAALRCGFVAGVWQHPAVRYPMLDSRAYHTRALEILAGNWLGNRIFYQDPLSPYFFAGLYATFGPGSLGVLLAQAVLDAGTVVLIFAIARRLFDFRCAVVAGVIALFYPLFFYYDALLLKVALTVFLITLALLLSLEAVGRDRPRLWLAAGLALGMAALTRGNYLLFIPVLLLWIAFAIPGAAALRGRRVAWVAAGACIAILPVTVRNHVVGDDFVLITSQAGQNVYIGNFRGNATGRYKPPPFLRANPFYEETDFRSEAERRSGGRSFKPSELSRFWLRASVREIRADPLHFLRHTLRKARLLVNDYEVPASSSFYFFREHVAPVLALPVPSYGELLPLALCGMFFARRSRRAQLMILFFVSYASTILLTFNMSRYRMPLVPVVIVFASAALWRIVGFARARSWRAAAATLAFLVVCYPFVYQDLGHDNFASNHLNIGAQHLRQAQRQRHLARTRARAGDEAAAAFAREAAETEAERAEQQFRAGLEIQPNHPALQQELAKLLLAQIREQREARAYEQALALARELTASLPTFADGFAALGRAYSDLGQYAAAREALRRALALEPGHPGATAELEFVNDLDPDASPP